jgi:ribonuclease P/MRP protein subunit POP3
LKRPEISADDQDTILELLCKYAMSETKAFLTLTPSTSLLSPIGQHRRAHTKPSRGKRAAKREPKESSKEDATRSPSVIIPPGPDLCKYVDVGFNSITKGLESISRPKTTEKLEERVSRRRYSMVFVTRGNQSSTFNCHFPKMVAASAKTLGPNDGIKLIGFSKPCSDRLSSCLGIARVSSIAIAEDAPGVEALSKFVNEHVPPVDAAWLDGSQDLRYRVTQIISAETGVGAKKMKLT